MTTTLFAPSALLPDGWTGNVRLTIDGGRFAAMVPDSAPDPGDPSSPVRRSSRRSRNLHSHAFQRAMAGMTERRGTGDDSFWTWRTVMYRFLDMLTPDDVEAIATSSTSRCARRATPPSSSSTTCTTRPTGRPTPTPAELAHRIPAAAADTGIGLTLLPVLYSFGGAGVPPPGGQRRFRHDLDSYARPREDRPPAPGRRRHPRHRPALAAGDVTGPDRGALAGPCPTPPSTYTPPSSQEVAAIEASLGARPPSPCCSTTSGSTPAGASSTRPT